MTSLYWNVSRLLNTLTPRWNRCHFADGIFKYIFLNENVWILIEISLKFVPGGSINNIPVLIQVMARRRQGDKPLSELKFVPKGPINTLRPRRNGRHFADDMFKCIFENVWIPIKISLIFVPKGPINNIPALVQIMAWRRPGYKPLSESVMVSLPTHLCVTRPQ